jgi:WD40 repeat protein
LCATIGDVTATGEQAEPASWDFFVSYTAKDRAWAEWLAWVLEDEGYRVLIQAWDFVPGSDWMWQMQEGIRRAVRTLAVLSTAYLGSVFGAKEWNSAVASDSSGFARKLLPVRIEDCERPGLLAGIVSIDVFGVSEADAQRRLLDGVRGAIDGRTKPTARPAFPDSPRAKRTGSRVAPATRVPAAPAASLATSPDPSAEVAAAPILPRAQPRRLLQPLTHPGGVLSVAFSPDGRTLATGCADRLVRLWDLADPAAVAPLGEPLQGHGDYVRSVAFSPDGRTLASVGDDGMLRLWDVAGPASPHVLTEQAAASVVEDNDADDGSGLAWDWVLAVAFSPDEELLATAGRDTVVRLWEVTDPGRPVQLDQWLRNESSVRSVAFSPNGQLLAAAGYPVRVWKIVDPVRPQRLRDLRVTANAVAFSPDGGRLASAGGDGTVRLWDLVEDGTPPEALELHAGAVNTVAFSPDGAVLASGSADKTVRLWDIADPANPVPHDRPLLGHTGKVQTVAFSPDGRLLASGGEDGMVRLWRF